MSERQILAMENAVLRNLLRETTQWYEKRLNGGGETSPEGEYGKRLAGDNDDDSSENLDTVPLDTVPLGAEDFEDDVPRPQNVSPIDFEGVAHNLAREATQRYDKAKAEIALLHSDLETILQTVREAVIRTDAHATVLELNAAAERLTGWREGAAHGRPLIDVVVLNDAAGHPTVLDLVPTLVRGESHNLEEGLTLERRDGVLFRIDGRLAALHGADGTVTGLILALRELDEPEAAKDL